MAARKAEAIWQGSLKEGGGSLKLSSGAYEGPYTWLSRFEEGAGTNPEELIAAAEAGCFTMQLAARLSNNGFTVEKLTTQAEVFLEKVDNANTITHIVMHVTGSVPGVAAAVFVEHAEAAKSGCIISRALNPSIEMVLMTELV
jgi:osmotically inducible protein OsmC